MLAIYFELRTSMQARPAMKAAVRAATVARFEAEREASARRFSGLVVEPRTQDMLKIYVEAISSKK